MSAAVFEERVDPGRFASALLALLVHLLLVAVLVFGVRWQNKPPDSITAELWEAPTPAPAPVIEPPKPAPRVETSAPKIEKPDIVEKAPPPTPLKPRVDEAEKEAQRRMREALAREQASIDIERERERIRDQLARDAASARTKVMADWVARVRAKIRGNMVLPPDIKGNPEAIFDVVQLPNGEVLSARLRKSSGQSALDEAIERAILKSSPLPRPDGKEAPPRAFELKYRPLDPL